MATVAEAVAATLREAGITRMFGLPGGEILDFIEAARRAGIEFVVTRDEATAAFIADAAGWLARRPAVCVSTLGPGAINMTLGVANAWLDRSPVIAITASLATTSAPYATHQQIDLNAAYRPFTKAAITLNGSATVETMRHVCETCLRPRMGPVHVAIPSDVARDADAGSEAGDWTLSSPSPPPPSPQALERVADAIGDAKRPVVLLGLDLEPSVHRQAVRDFVGRLGVPVFATPKVKGLLPEDDPRFFGICGGLAGDAVILDLFARADLLVGVGFDPVESDKLWHHSMPIVSLGPLSIAAGQFQPRLEVTGDLLQTLSFMKARLSGPFDWTTEELVAFRGELRASCGRATPPPVDYRRGR